MRNSGCRVIRISVVFLLSLLAIGLMGAFVWQAPAALAADDESETPAVVTGIQMDSESEEVPVGSSLLLTVTVLPEEADSPALVWVSSNEAVAAVDQEGQVTAVSEGSAVITVTADGFSDTCTVTVTPTPKVSLELKDEEVTLAQNDTQPLDISVTSQDGESISLSWTSSDPGIVSVDQSGHVTACGTGAAEISVSADGVSDVCIVYAVSAQIESTQYTIDRNTGLLQGVPLETSVDELKACLGNNAESIMVYDCSGQPCTSGNVGTGAVVKLVINDTVRDQLAVRIVGDVDGDGQMGVCEYTMARVHLLGQSSLSDNEKDLLDVNRDSRVGITDYTLIRLDILGLNPGGDNLGGIPDFKPSGSAADLGCSAVISWGGAPSANGYDLYRAECPSGPYQLLASFGGDRLSYTDDTLAMEKTYYYKVIAYRLLGSMKFDSLSSDAIAVSTPRFTTYYQGDSQWRFSRSVRKTACVISSYAILINNMGISANPRTVYEANGNSTSIDVNDLRSHFGVTPVCALSPSSPYLAGFDGHKTYIRDPASNAVGAIKEALQRNPEGVVLYFKKGSDAHAIVACKVVGDTIYFSDPGRDRSELVDFANTWCKVGHNMSYRHLVEMIALDRA